MRHRNLGHAADKTCYRKFADLRVLDCWVKLSECLHNAFSSCANLAWLITFSKRAECFEIRGEEASMSPESAENCQTILQKFDVLKDLVASIRGRKTRTR